MRPSYWLWRSIDGLVLLWSHSLLVSNPYRLLQQLLLSDVCAIWILKQILHYKSLRKGLTALWLQNLVHLRTVHYVIFPSGLLSDAFFRSNLFHNWWWLRINLKSGVNQYKDLTELLDKALRKETRNTGNKKRECYVRTCSSNGWRSIDAPDATTIALDWLLDSVHVMCCCSWQSWRQSLRVCLQASQCRLVSFAHNRTLKPRCLRDKHRLMIRPLTQLVRNWKMKIFAADVLSVLRYHWVNVF